ncbi:MAG: putative toxin-antitoxin system toxin component, PIN family [Actinobacteria bacterium]|nr:putative toxin-antitoxin system toxin component, PIN family [Cyanobacteriota bacterium]MCL5770786.1 putative toxin-antitoxin system toxin component, PIN family [Actinomycetota bacterium]
MKVVIDTNVFISSFFKQSINPRKIIDLWKTSKLVVCLTKEIIEEYLEVLMRLGLAGEPELYEFIKIFERKENILYFNMVQKIDLEIDDSDDLKFIECAVAGKASYIISGDKHLLNLKEYNDIQIISPGEFLTVNDF